MKIYEMLLANAMGESGGGGGGSGDFEVVTLTLINNNPTNNYYDAGGMVWVDEISDVLATEPYMVGAGETVQVPVVLYKGKAVMYPNDWDDTIAPIITGNVTYNSEEWSFEITGAGSIALTGTGGIM